MYLGLFTHAKLPVMQLIPYASNQTNNQGWVIQWKKLISIWICTQMTGKRNNVCFWWYFILYPRIQKQKK